MLAVTVVTVAGEPAWVYVSVGAAALAAVITSVVRWVIRPLLRAAVTFEEVTPTLVAIAKDFKGDNGHTLTDQLAETTKRIDAHDARFTGIEHDLAEIKVAVKGMRGAVNRGNAAATTERHRIRD